MRLLWIATKSPAPPVDGGRLVSWLTLETLARNGVEVTLVAPTPPEADVSALEAELAPVCRPRLVPTLPQSQLVAVGSSLLGGPPYSVSRHTINAVRAEVVRRLDAEEFDVVHAEQLQALAQAEPAHAARIPVVLRAQNVESDLWAAAAALHPWAGPWLAREGRRLARYEGEAIRRASATVALTRRDAGRLRELAGGAETIEVVHPPFPAELPPATVRLAGEPAVVLLGSGGWLPNRDGIRWFLEAAWPEVLRRVPQARLHLFAEESERPRDLPPGVEPHAPPKDSREAFAPGSLLAVPLRVASGIRMKILEAWARGVPVIATPEAAAGLDAEPGREVAVAVDGPGFAAAIERLAGDPEAAEVFRTAGRGALRARFDPAPVCAELVAVYDALAFKRH